MSSLRLLGDEFCITCGCVAYQAVRSGLEEAQQQLVTTSSEEAKAEAMIAIEVHEAMAKAIE
jgi:hypothetical protein